MSEFDQFESLKSFVYGIGRGCGIQVTPRHHSGSLDEQIRSLAHDIVAANVHPSDAELGDDVEIRRRRLEQSVGAVPTISTIETVITDYIQSRLGSLNRDAVE